MFMVLS